MPTPHPAAGMARVIALEVALLEAEADLMAQLIAAGIMPPGARREPTVPELRAGVRFAALDKLVTDAAALITRKANRVREHVLDGLATELAPLLSEPDPYRALEQLDRLTDPTRADSIPGLRPLVDEVAGEVKTDLLRVAEAGAAEALDEARRQGIPDRLIGDVGPLGPQIVAAAETHAQRVALAPARKVLDAAAQGGSRAATAAGATGADVLTGALDAAEQASTAGAEDTARQAANVTHGLGRTQAQAALPAPKEVYASELLDSNTCGPCAAVDGRTYDSLASALVDYPGAGGYIACEGGARCRGTLVLVHHTEAGPTLDNPGQGPPAPHGPVDRTPKGPSGAGRPDHIAPDGSLIPTPPDKGTAPASALSLAVDETGRTILPPLDTIEPPVDPVAPVDVDRDPELATWEDHHLEALIEDDAEPLERRLAAADELDQRNAGTRSQVYREEALDADTLASYEEDRAAWEAAGGDAADAVLGLGGLGEKAAGAGPKGRRIDHVRAAWSEQVERMHLDAEDVTRGYLVRKDRLEEFRAKYPSGNTTTGGGGDTSVLFEGPANTAYYYASPELRAYWDTLPNGRDSFAEFCARNGIRDRKTLDRARAAQEARDGARLRADESAAGKAKRAAQRAQRKRLPMTEGDRLVAAQKRRDRIRAAERKQQLEHERLQREFGDVPNPAAPVAEEPPHAATD